MPVRNNTENRLCGAWKILLTYFKKLSFMSNLAKHRIQYSILLNIKYIRNLKHTSYHNVLHVKKITAKQFILKMNTLYLEYKM